MENQYNRGQLIAETRKDERDREKLKETKGQGQEGKKQTKILLAVLVIAVFTFIGNFVIQGILDYQKTEKQYQACLEQCDLGGVGQNDSGYIPAGILGNEKERCRAGCKEKYGK